MKRFWGIFALVACLLLCGFAAAEEEERVIERGALTAVLPVKGAQVEISSTRIDGEEWLFLPAFADLEALYPDAQETEESGVWYDEALDLHLMRSENLRALFLFSDDPAGHGREYVESSERHETKSTGFMAVVNVDGRVEHAGELTQLRGRGNSTWDMAKKPYQFKLREKADLLKTGDPAEERRTWVLLADSLDATFLHNRLLLDLGLEIGIDNSSHSEHVDLYYDGEYRGLYLLTEKVEAGRGRLGVKSADKVIEAINEHVGVGNLEELSIKAEDHPLNGMRYSYIEGMAEPEDPSSLSYILEMEGENTTLSDRCWFHLSDGSVLACKNPENASQRMILYISTRLEEALQTLLHGGINPENGRTIEDDFDVDEFARVLMINEFYHTADNYTYSSSWFVLPEGETRFHPGTLWDGDLGLRVCRDGMNERGVGLRAMKDWPLAFYGCDVFVEAAKRIYLEEITPLLESVLLGDQQGKYLMPLDDYVRQIDASRRMDARIWKSERYFEFRYANDYEGEIGLLRTFLSQRHAWLKQALSGISPYTADSIVLWGNAEYGHVDSNVQLRIAPWSNAQIANAAWEQISEATEEDYAVWQLEAFIVPEEGYAFGDAPTVSFGGEKIGCEKQQDGSLRILVTFEDPSYRPVDYYGEDIGLIYNPEIYAQNYPEIAAEYEGDPDGLMDYFCDDGMYEDQKGNAFFRPSEILVQNADLMDVLGEDWQLYYWEFLAYGYADGWLQPGMSPGFGLDVKDAL